MARCSPRSSSGSTLGRNRQKIRNISAVQRPMPRTWTSSAITASSSISAQAATCRLPPTKWRASPARYSALRPDRPQPTSLAGPARLVGCGLSGRKAEYLAGLARHFVGGSLHVAAWAEMDDEAVIAELVQVRGIGRWTAEMFLIFCLLRPNVLPLDDLGLQRAICRNYFRGKSVSLRTMRKIAEGWDPWRSVATWYLWRSLDPIPVEY